MTFFIDKLRSAFVFCSNNKDEEISLIQWFEYFVTI